MYMSAQAVHCHLGQLHASVLVGMDVVHKVELLLDGAQPASHAAESCSGSSTHEHGRRQQRVPSQRLADHHDCRERRSQPAGNSACVNERHRLHRVKQEVEERTNVVSLPASS